MKKPEFTGKALSFEEQIGLLESEGLVIGDRGRALHILENISFSHFKSYLIPLRKDRYEHGFIPGSTIEQAYAFYGFDRRLRELVFHEMEKVEISIRTRLGYASMDDEAGYWFVNPDYFINKDKHESLLFSLERELKRSDDDSIRRFYEKYSNRFPPCWMTLEASSMGTLAALYSNLQPGDFKKKLCSYYGISDAVFSSWVNHLVYVRNICAHHSRLWNRHMKVLATYPTNTRYGFPEIKPGTEKYLYMTLCVIRYMINVIKPSNTFSERLQDLLDHFPQISESQMGFPEGWRSDPFWE